MRFSNLLFIIGLVTTLLCTSCKIEQDITFEKDFSGHHETKMDLSGAIEMLETLSGPGMGSGVLDSINEEDISSGLKGIEGISGISVSKDKAAGTVTIAYDFNDIASLNRAMNNENSSSLGQPTDNTAPTHEYFSLDGKVLTYEMQELNPDDHSALEQYKELGAGMEMHYVVRMNFAKKSQELHEPSL